MTWKDRMHPSAGGAEVVNEELAKRLVDDGHKVKFIVGGYKDCKPNQVINGYQIIRLGNRVSVYYKTWRYYRKHMIGWADLVIDEVNTIPFLAKFYVKERSILFVHMLCRKIWFYQTIFPISILGYILEPLYLRILSNQKVITISKSTFDDLVKFGFKPTHISIIPEIIELKPASNLRDIKKYSQPTVLCFGSIRPMKRTLDVVKAFEIAKVKIPNLQLKIAGADSGRYAIKLLNTIKTSIYKNDIEFIREPSDQNKRELMQRCHLIAVSSIKEGWALTVSEAASQGTPAVVYNVDGLRDSVVNGKTGWVTLRNTPVELAKTMEVAIKNTARYDTIRSSAWAFSCNLTAALSYRAFWDVIKGNT